MSRSRAKNSAASRRRAHVGLADDLDERHAAAVVVDVGPAIGVGKPFVQRLARVLFHVDARQADPRRAAAGGDLEAAAERQRPLVLRDLIALRQVRIEVVLPREDRRRLHVAAERQRRLDRVVDRLAVEHRQRARAARGTPDRPANSAAAPNAVLQPQKILVCVSQLRVDLEADDRLVRHGPSPDRGSVRDGRAAVTPWTGLLDRRRDVLLERLEFSTNIAASFFACSSYWPASRHVLRGSSTLVGHAGTRRRHVEVEDRMRLVARRCRAGRSSAAVIIARVCAIFMRLPTPYGPPVQPVLTSHTRALCLAIFSPSMLRVDVRVAAAGTARRSRC